MNYIKAFVCLILFTSYSFASSPEKMEALCKKNKKVDSCFEYGKYLFENEGSEAKEGMLLVVTACKKKYKKACVWVTEQNETLRTQVSQCVNGKIFSSCEKIKYACEKIEFSPACSALARYWQQQDDLFMTKTYIEKSCQYGDIEDCKLLGFILEKEKQIAEKRNQQKPAEVEYKQNTLTNGSESLLNYYLNQNSNTKTSCRSKAKYGPTGTFDGYDTECSK